MIRALRSSSCRCERHGRGKGGEQRKEQRKERRGKASGGVMRTGTAEGEADTNGEGRGGWGEKRSPLVEYVSEYWEVYEGDGADKVRHL